MTGEEGLAELRTKVEKLSQQLAALSQDGASDTAAIERELLAIEAAALILATRASSWRTALPRERSRWPGLMRRAGQRN